MISYAFSFLLCCSQPSGKFKERIWRDDFCIMKKGSIKYSLTNFKEFPSCKTNPLFKLTAKLKREFSSDFISSSSDFFFRSLNDFF